MISQINIVLLMTVLILECFGLVSAQNYTHKARSRYSKNAPTDIPLGMESEDRKVYHWIQESNCNECGRVPLKMHSEGRRSGRIVNGTPVIPPNKYPWMVYIHTRTKYDIELCGGVIISANFILTAAHCLQSSDNFVWQTGNTCYYTNRTSEPCYHKKDDVSVYLYNNRLGPLVAEVLPHPEFHILTNSKNDIALLRLSHSIQYNNYAIPICLPPHETNILIGTQVVVTGWGQTHPVDKTIISKELREGYIIVTDKRKCSIFEDLETQFCLSGEGKLATCFGDSGGPIMYESRGMVFTLGVLSSIKSHDGTKTCYLNNLTVCTRVQHFLSWIYRVSGISPCRI